MDRSKHAFFESVQRQERESRNRREDPEYHKRWMLKSMSNGFANGTRVKPKITLAKMSWEKDDGK
jgi:hypothetical protein